jgi:hypothetical protein
MGRTVACEWQKRAIGAYGLGLSVLILFFRFSHSEAVLGLVFLG